MTDIPAKSSLINPGSTEGVFQDALGAFYDVIAEMAENGDADPQTISSGSITPLRALVAVETEGSAATDDLTTIDASAVGSKLLIIGLQQSGRTLTVKHNTSGADHIRLKNGADYVMLNPNTYLVLRRNSEDGYWQEIMRTSADLSIPTISATGTSDVIVANFPAPLLMSDHRLLVVRASTANLTTTPTINVDGSGAKTIVKKANAALSIGDISGPGYPIMLQYDAGLDKFVMLNPAKRTELDLFLSDNSTLNANTTRHGFLRKLSGNDGDYLNGAGNWAAIPSAKVDEFYASATWNKPSTGSIAIVELWGAGASGSRGNSGGGGGGGCYRRVIFLLSDLPSSVSVTVGAGGAPTNTNSTTGADGGDSSFGSLVTAYGGSRAASSNYVGGPGAGINGKGASGIGGAPKGGAAAVSPNPADSSLYGGGGAGTTSSSGTCHGGGSAYGGGGGGGAQGPSARASKGGESIYGGGGGGGSNLTFAYSDNSGGVSRFGGSGGKGANWVNWNSTPAVYDAPGDGGFPGGGGGGTNNSYSGVAEYSGAGGDGFVRVIVI